MSSDTRTLAEAIGFNARKLRTRAGLTLDEVAIASKLRGLRWSNTRVADFEAGRVSPNLETTIALALALSDLGCGPVTMAELVDSQLPLSINDSVDLPADHLSLWFRGAEIRLEPPELRRLIGAVHVKLPGLDEELDLKTLERLESADISAINLILAQSGIAEERVQKSLHITRPLLAIVSSSLWGQTFSQERDERAGPEANAQHRGRISRQLKDELRIELRIGND
ncbi:helix-turn-helix domain-containing protein [Antrihabitans spumae]|uniref:Helix-turn-helix domain-containing protein n=1 Tax=Antrihabitans spumae TaxID=3373370 RepID=A0ABW7KHY9_9NOCA